MMRRRGRCVALGNHIRALVDGAWRHGIDCGDRTVLFLSSEGGRPEVRRALAAAFAPGGGRAETVVHREPVFAPRMVVARAFSRLRDAATAAAFHSSEAFAAWCVSGRAAEPACPCAPEPPRATRRKGPARRAAGERKARHLRPEAPRRKAPARRARRSRR